MPLARSLVTFLGRNLASLGAHFSALSQRMLLGKLEILRMMDLRVVVLKAEDLLRILVN
ncbi:Unknown protein, partial [Striga hermonthica]